VSGARVSRPQHIRICGAPDNFERQVAIVSAAIGTAPRLPKIPRALPHNPRAEQKICDGVRRHGVTEPVFADHQPLKRRADVYKRQALIPARIISSTR